MDVRNKIASLRLTIGEGQRLLNQNKYDKEIDNESIQQMINFHQLALDRVCEILEQMEADLRQARR